MIFDKAIQKVNSISKLFIVLLSLAVAFPFSAHAMEESEQQAQTYHSKFILKEKEGVPIERKVVRILCVDGGGVRGIIPATVLEGIEDHLRPKITPEKVNLAKYFDIMAGTSTGGIIVLGLNADKSAEDLAKLYLNQGNRIFHPVSIIGQVQAYAGPKYNAGSLEEVLYEQFGDAWLKDAPSHVLIPTDDLGQDCAYLFDSKAALDLKSQSFKMKDVARATSAAPTYFEAATIQDEKENAHTYLDGGLYSNDPTFEAIQMAEKRFPGCDLFIVSLGTGETPRRFGDLSLKNAGKLKWASAIPGELMDRAQDRHLKYLETLKAVMEQQGRNVKYHRIQISIPIELSELDVAGNIRSLREAGNYLLNPQNVKGEYQELMEIVESLERIHLEQLQVLDLL